MSQDAFVHLHNHSEYSLLDGACRIRDMVGQAVEWGMPALALTDHGSLHGVIEFYREAVGAGIKPIIGCEVYVAPGDRRDRRARQGEIAWHLVLLARNDKGYRNLMKLSSLGYLEGFYYKPRVDKALLRQYSEGLIALSACLQGEVTSHNINGRRDAAKKAALEYQDIFGEENFYLEVQHHDIEAEIRNIDAMISLSRELGIPLVATNDVHFMKPEHADSHEVLLCVQTGKTLSDTDRMHSNSKLYFRPYEEMARLFAGIPEALSNTAVIAERCNLVLEFDQMHLPRYPLPAGFSSLTEYMRHLAFEGALRRYPVLTPELEQRLEYELGIIDQMGFAGYFLIVADFTQQARRMGIPVGPGRGSAAGSLVSYCLGITNIDPIKYDLLFERFLNPERVSMPDIDIDFCYERRNEIIRYVVDKYGEESVSQIITFGTMKARAAVRDVGRVMGLPYSEVDRLAKLVPETLGIELEQALHQEPALQEAITADDRYRRLFEHAKVLEGLARHASTHAAGVVITPGPLTDFVPLYRGSRGEVTTQYSMTDVEHVGLLKVDFLGLRTLTVLHDAQQLVERGRGETIDLDELPLDDRATYELFSRGDTVGIFQFESSGMRDYLRKLRPTVFDDLVAMNALYRPGPLGSNMVDDFIDRKHGRKRPEYPHPALESILESTYGIIVYQEQVMRIASELAGFSLGEADLLRRAMGKKKAEVMEEQREKFMAGAGARGVDRATAERVFELMAFFAGYGFNKSHSAGYALVAYQTAWFKAHHPAEFMAATLSSEMSESDRVVILIEEARRLGLEVAPPDVNESEEKFSVTGRGVIRFGLGAVKNVGHGAIASILEARREGERFESLTGLLERTDLKSVNKRVLESLVAAGACDSLGGHRAQLIAALGRELEAAQKRQSEKEKGQVSMFEPAGDGGAVLETHEAGLPDVPEWGLHEMLTREKESLGFYVSGHPLERHRDEVNAFATARLGEMEGQADNSLVTVAGIVTGVNRKTDRKGNPFAFVTLEDFSGSAEMLVFSETYQQYSELIQADNMVLVKGQVSKREGDSPKVRVSEFIPLDQVRSRLTRALHLLLVSDEGATSARQARAILDEHPGEVPVYIHLEHGEEGPPLRLRSRDARIDPAGPLLDRLKTVLGEENVWVST